MNSEIMYKYCWPYWPDPLPVGPTGAVEPPVDSIVVNSPISHICRRPYRQPLLPPSAHTDNADRGLTTPIGPIEVSIGLIVALGLQIGALTNMIGRIDNAGKSDVGFDSPSRASRG